MRKYSMVFSGICLDVRSQFSHCTANTQHNCVFVCVVCFYFSLTLMTSLAFSLSPLSLLPSYSIVVMFFLSFSAIYEYFSDVYLMRRGAYVRVQQMFRCSVVIIVHDMLHVHIIVQQDGI